MSIDKETATIVHDGEQFNYTAGIAGTYNFTFTLETGGVNTGKIIGYKDELFRITATVSRDSPLNPQGAAPLLTDVYVDVGTEGAEEIVTASTSVTFEDSQVTLNMSFSTCEEYNLICWEINPAPGANWYWYDPSNTTDKVASCKSFVPDTEIKSESRISHNMQLGSNLRLLRGWVL